MGKGTIAEAMMDSISTDDPVNCHVGVVERDPGSEQVVIQYPPRRAIGIVHLSYSSKMMQSYLKRGLLWDRGAYLSEKETTELLRTAHY